VITKIAKRGRSEGLFYPPDPAAAPSAASAATRDECRRAALFEVRRDARLRAGSIVLANGTVVRSAVAA